MNSRLSTRITSPLLALALGLSAVASTAAHAAERQAAGTSDSVATPLKGSALGDVPESGASTKFLRNGYLIDLKHHSESAATPNLKVYDSSGKLLYELTIWPSRTSKLFLSSVDIGRDNTLAFAGQAVRDDDVKTNFIAIDHLGHTAPKYIPTRGYLASQIAIADDSSIWAIGDKPSDDALSKPGSSVPNYDVLRHFAPDGTLIDHLMKRWGDGISYVTHSDVPKFVTGHTSDESVDPTEVESLTHNYRDAWKAGSDIYLRAHGTSVFLYDGRVTAEPGHTQPTLIESDAATRTNSLRYVIPLQSVYVPQIADLSIAADGEIYSHQHTASDTNVAASVGLFKLVLEQDGIHFHWQLVPSPLVVADKARSASSLLSSGAVTKVTPLCAPATYPCLAYDYYRSVAFIGVPTGANHNFWFFETLYGTAYVTDGGPSAGSCSPAASLLSECGYVERWILPGTIGHYSEDNVASATLWFNSGYTTANCVKVGALFTAATIWTTTLTYHLTGPNSNFFAYSIGVAGGFSVPTPPASPGW